MNELIAIEQAENVKKWCREYGVGKHDRRGQRRIQANIRRGGIRHHAG